MRLPALLSALLITIGAPGIATGSPGSMREPARMTIGDPKAEHVNIIVSPEAGESRALTIQTRRVGAPGSRFRLSVDRGLPLVSAILDAEQCRFDDQGSVCTISYARKSAEYRKVVPALRKGRNARVEIENAGNMAMSRDVSLAGFAKTLGSER